MDPDAWAVEKIKNVGISGNALYGKLRAGAVRGGKGREKMEIKTVAEQRLLDDLKAAKDENKALRLCLESVSRYKKEQHEFELKCAREIVERDNKAVANVILNMTFGKQYVSFCEIFGLKEAGGCEMNERCTDCIFSWLQDYFGNSASAEAGWNKRAGEDGVEE